VKKLPIGIQSFEEMIKENYYYVDKTTLIKDIIDLAGKVKLITRPRRFGKTLNMDMIRRFFAMDEEENLFEDLKIWNEKGLLKDYYHRCPVIFVSFRDVKEPTWDKAIDKMKMVLSEHAKLYKKFAKDEDDVYYIRRIIRKEASESEYSSFLKFLTWLLHKETGMKPVVLIDEYDVPIEAAYTYREKDPDYYDNMVAFMRDMLAGALKDNPYLEFGILTGVYRVAKESIFSGLNNLAVYTVFENEMSDKFGFTEEEVREMLKHYDLDDEDLDVVRKWYGGYIIGKEENLYNPWSVIYYVKERTLGERGKEEAPQPFWINTSSNDIIKEQVEKNPSLKGELEELLQMKEIEKTIDPYLSLRELEKKKEGVWTLLASSGYLSAKRVRGFNKYSLRIPNEELLYFFKDSVMEWIENTCGTNMGKMLNELYELLEKGTYEGFAESLKEYIEGTMSYLDIGGREPERVYKAFLLGILSIAINGYVVESERESGYGRLDVVVYPKERKYGHYAAIFEVKRVEKGENLETFAKQALDQIRERKYYSKMRDLGYKVIGFGVVFCGKKVAIEVEAYSHTF